MRQEQSTLSHTKEYHKDDTRSSERDISLSGAPAESHDAHLTMHSAHKKNVL